MQKAACKQVLCSTVILTSISAKINFEDAVSDQTFLKTQVSSTENEMFRINLTLAHLFKAFVHLQIASVILQFRVSRDLAQSKLQMGEHFNAMCISGYAIDK